MLDLRPADADRQRDPVVGERGGGRDLLGGEIGVAHREDEGVRREAELLRDGRERSRRHPGIGEFGGLVVAANAVFRVGIGRVEGLRIDGVVGEADRRKTYALTEKGKTVLKEHIRRCELMAENGRMTKDW